MTSCLYLLPIHCLSSTGMSSCVSTVIDAPSVARHEAAAVASAASAMLIAGANIRSPNGSTVHTCPILT